MSSRVLQVVVVLTSIGVLSGCAATRPLARAKAPIQHQESIRQNGEFHQVTSASRDNDVSPRAASIRPPEGVVRRVNSQVQPPENDRADANPEIQPTSATDPDDPALSNPLSTMSLQQLEDLALQNNPTLVQAQAEIEVDLGYLKQAGLYPNPQGGYYNESASNPSVRQANGIFLSQEFVTAHKLDLAQQSILQEIKQMQWDQQAQRMRVLNDLKIRYYEVLGAQQAVAIAGKLVTAANETVTIAERLLQAKNASRSDLLQAKVQLETARLNQEDAQFRYQAAWQQMMVIVGVPTLPISSLSGDLMEELPDLNEETCLQRLMSSSPQLAGSASQLDHGWAEYRSQQALAIPNVTVQAIIDYDRATQSTTASTLVAMPLPFHNRNQGNIDKAAADVRLFQAEIKRVELVLRDQLADSFRRYKSSKRQVEVMKQSILPNAEENLQLSREIYAAGESNFNSVLIAQQTYFQSQMAYVEALTELGKVVTEINGLQLTGGLNPPAIGSAIQAQPGGGAQRQRALLKEVQDRAQKQLLPATQLAQ